MLQLSDLAIRLLDSNTHFILSTIGRDGVPQSSVIWAKRDDNEILFSTVRGRRKELNMARDPRISLCGYESGQPRNYIQIQGLVSMSEEGGKELINELYLRYDGMAFADSDSSIMRVTCRLVPKLVVTRLFPNPPESTRA